MKNSNKSLIISGVKNARRSQKVTWAASLGDRSENADYQYNKSVCVKSTVACAISLNAWKISKSSITPLSRKAKSFGAWVEIENDDGVTHRFRIVGYDEILAVKITSLSIPRWPAHC